MKIHNTINMCEQKCISEQYSNRANLLKREIQGILKNLYSCFQVVTKFVKNGLQFIARMRQMRLKYYGKITRNRHVLCDNSMQ